MRSKEFRRPQVIDLHLGTDDEWWEEAEGLEAERRVLHAAVSWELHVQQRHLVRLDRGALKDGARLRRPRVPAASNQDRARRSNRTRGGTCPPPRLSSNRILNHSEGRHVRAVHADGRRCAQATEQDVCTCPEDGCLENR